MHERVGKRSAIAEHDDQHEDDREKRGGIGKQSLAATLGDAHALKKLGPGAPLPSQIRVLFGGALDRDLSHVRVHDTEQAHALAHKLEARAVTVGNDIAFAKGQYDPHSPQGTFLLAHEVAHAEQQTGATASGPLELTRIGGEAESNADSAAMAMVRGLKAQLAPQPMAFARKAANEPLPIVETEKPEGETIGELTADRVGQEPDDSGDAAPEEPKPDTAATRQALAAGGKEAPGAEGGEAAEHAPSGGGGGGGGGAAELTGQLGQARAEIKATADEAEGEAAAYKAEQKAQQEKFDAQQQQLALAQLKTMSSKDKRAALADLGYDPKVIKKLKDSELDGIITGKLEAEARKTKILGMEPQELAALSSAKKLEFLCDLGIDRDDLQKAGTAKCDKLFADVVAAAKVPGQHKVKIQIKGGLFGKSWVVTVKCDAEGQAEIDAKKEGGFLSKLVGWIKLALPLILTVLAPLTAGASLIALSVYQTVMAIKSGDWLGAIVGAAGAFAGLGALNAIKNGASGLAQTLVKVGGIATKVQKAAQTAQAALAAAKAKNPGSLLAALAAGASTFATFASNSAGKFATRMNSLADKLKKWSAIATGGQAVVQGIQHGDAIAAIGGAFTTVGAFAGGNTEKTMQRAANITAFVNAGKRALQSDPPNYGAVAEAAMGIAAQLNTDRRVEDAHRIIQRANILKQAWDARSSNPAALLQAAMGLAESIQVAKYDLDHDEKKDADGKPLPEPERTAIVDRYQRANRVVGFAGAALRAVTARPPSFTAALDAAMQLAAEFTADKRLDQAAKITSGLDAWKKAIASGDQRAIMAAAIALGEAINGMRGAIEEEHTKAKQDAEAKVPEEKLPPVDVLPPGPNFHDLLDSVPGLPTKPDVEIEREPVGTVETTEGGFKPDDRGGIPADVKGIINMVKEFAAVAQEFEEPSVHADVAQWQALVADVESQKDQTRYQVAMEKLRALHRDAGFAATAAKEISKFEHRLNPFQGDKASVQALGRLERNLGRLVRVAAIPQDFVDIAKNLVIVCGYKDEGGAPATPAERITAAHEVMKAVPKLHGTLTWAGRIAQTLIEKYAPGSIAVRMDAILAASRKYGVQFTEVMVRHCKPVLEKISEKLGLEAAERLAARIAAEIAEWLPKSQLTKQIFKGLCEKLGTRIGLRIFEAATGPVAIAIDINLIALQIANDTFGECFDALSMMNSNMLFGTHIADLKRHVRGMPRVDHVSCNAFFHYVFDQMLDNAMPQVRHAWPEAYKALPSRLGTHPVFDGERGHMIKNMYFSGQPAAALSNIDVGVDKIQVADLLAQLACDFLDAEYRKEFHEDPTA